MSTEVNKAVVRRFFEVTNIAFMEGLADQRLAPGYRLRFNSMPEMGREEATSFYRSFFTAFPDLEHDIQDQIAEGDRVATRIVVRATHQGDFMGMPATGRVVEIRTINVHRIVDGRIVEQWVISDGVGPLQQLGALPQPTAA
jgi:steroid delta-isomerase-like uncharacterized protein